ncbi:hypothetical protein HN011_000852 [Eciton burchellii]|nr:hypothetical protein HN011_000852 [Eciton burchellii]
MHRDAVAELISKLAFVSGIWSPLRATRRPPRYPANVKGCAFRFAKDNCDQPRFKKAFPASRASHGAFAFEPRGIINRFLLACIVKRGKVRRKEMHSRHEDHARRESGD